MPVNRAQHVQIHGTDQKGKKKTCLLFATHCSYRNDATVKSISQYPFYQRMYTAYL